MKLTAIQGLVLATLILGVIGAVFAELNVYIVSPADLSAIGVYGDYLKAFFSGIPIIIVLTWIYNVFGYMTANQTAALKEVVEMYDTTKLIATLVFMLSILGPIVTLAPAEWKTIGSLIVVVVTALINWIPKVFSTTPTTPALSKPTA